MHWWADLWDNWAKIFGYDHWEWGSASDAFAAIGTVGALAVTLHIVRNDRRAKTEEQARLITGWWDADELEMPGDGQGSLATGYLIVNVHNSSTLPVTGVSAIYFLKDGYGHNLPFGGNAKVRHTTLRPHTEGVFKGSVYGHKDDIDNVALVFYDANGVHWTRNLKTQEILQTRTSKTRRHLDHYWWLIRTGGGNWGPAQRLRNVRK